LQPYLALAEFVTRPQAEAQIGAGFIIFRGQPVRQSPGSGQSPEERTENPGARIEADSRRPMQNPFLVIARS
jgi:hypothetical protein